MSRSAADSVVQCRGCRGYFEPGIDGEGDLCDRCADSGELAEDVTPHLINDEGAA